MSDTTITPEERASWRERLESPFSCHDSKHGAFTLRLLTALEAAEAEVRKLRQQSRRLQQKCNSLSNKAITDEGLKQILDITENAPGGFAANHEYGVLNIIGKAQSGKDLHCCIRLEDLSFFSDAKATIRRLVGEVQRLRQKEASEAENTRLTKMVDWLANQLDCPSEFTNCAVDCAECRKEAARRAVAAESEVRE